MVKKAKKYINEFKCAIILQNFIKGIDPNFLSLKDLEHILTLSDTLGIYLSDFNLEEHEYNNKMHIFIFNIWREEADLNAEIAEKLLINYLEENL